MQIREERLFERIRNKEQPPHTPPSSGLKIMEASITNHLRQMLNTRQGSALIAPDYGIPDFTDLLTDFNPGTIDEIEEALRQIILKYEPRLSDVRVLHQENTRAFVSGLSFKLQSTLRYKGREVPVVFETVLEPDGKIHISGEDSDI